MDRRKLGGIGTCGDCHIRRCNLAVQLLRGNVDGLRLPCQLSGNEGRDHLVFGKLLASRADVVPHDELAERELTEECVVDNGIYFTPMNFGAWSNCGLALSRKAMKYFIDYLDKVFTAADIPIFESTNNIPIYGNIQISGLKHYIPTAPIVYLINNNDSQVQTRQKDDTELYKYYEQINKDLYII